MLKGEVAVKTVTRFSALDPRVSQAQLERQEAAEYQTSSDEEDVEPPFQLQSGYSTLVAVDNLPLVDEKKYDKLCSVIDKVFKKLNARVVEKGINMPYGKDGQTKGFAFIEFETPEEAKEAMKADNFRLDKSHVLRVTPFDDLEKYENVTSEYTPPPKQEYTPREHLREWMMDVRARDQFVIRYADETEIFWNDPYDKPTLAYGRKKWTETYVTWSSKGTYLATFHLQGIVVWGGSSFTRLMRFAHPNVVLMDFSPCETYLVTYSEIENDNPKDPKSLIVWNVKTGKKMRAFVGQKENLNWPIFKWSHDDKYLARQGEDSIKIYETPGMNLLNKKAIAVRGLKEFTWSPSDNILSYWCPEHSNNPAKVCVMSVPSCEVLRQNNLFNVVECNMHWQNTGDYVCVKVDRHTKSKKTKYTSFEIFRVKEADCPVDVLQMKDPVVAFAWEPNGHRFAVVHGEVPRPDVTFYSTEKNKKGEIIEIKTLEKKSVNHLFWSPKGRYIVFAGLKGLNGVLEFWDAGEMESMATEEHFMATDIDWDPTGRYVASSVSQWRHQMENGYYLWDFRGRCLQRVAKDKFYQLLWRPRQDLLDAAEIKHIKKTMKEFAARFELEDNERAAGKEEGFIKHRREMLDEYAELEKRLAEIRAQEKEARIAISGVDSDDDSDSVFVEQTVEELIETSEEVVAATTSR